MSVLTKSLLVKSLTLLGGVISLVMAWGQTTAAEPTAASLLARSAATMVIHDVIQTHVRVDVAVAGEMMSAHGQYLEQKNYDQSSTMMGQPMFRLDLKFPPDSHAPPEMAVNEMVIVCNARSISHYTSIEGVSRLERVGVQDLDRAIRESKTVSLPYTLSAIGGLGGLAGMVKQLSVYYDFVEPPQSLVLDGKELRQCWKLVGRLKKTWQTSFTEAACAGTNRHDRSATLVPVAIEIFLGRDDLFPYRIHYLAAPNGIEPQLAARVVFSGTPFRGEPSPLFKFETFDRELPPGIIIDDVTQPYLNSLKL